MKKQSNLTVAIISVLAIFLVTGCGEDENAVTQDKGTPLVDYTPCMQNLTADCTYEAMQAIDVVKSAQEYLQKDKQLADFQRDQKQHVIQTTYELHNRALANYAAILAMRGNDLETLKSALSVINSVADPSLKTHEIYLLRKDLTANTIRHFNNPTLIKDYVEPLVTDINGNRITMTTWRAQEIMPLVTGLIRMGALKEAHEVASFLTPYFKALSYLEVGQAYREKGNTAEAATIFSEAAAALLASPQIDNESLKKQKAYVAYEVGVALGSVADKRGVEKMLSYQMAPEHDAETLSELAGALIQKGKKKEAMQYVAAAKKASSKIRVRKNERGAEAKVKSVQNLALAEASQGKFGLALHLAKEIETINAHPPKRGNGMTGFVFIDVAVMLYKAYTPPRKESYANFYNYATTLLDIANMQNDALLKEDAEKTVDLATAVLRKMEGNYSLQSSGFAAAAAMYSKIGLNDKQVETFGLARRITGNLPNPNMRLEQYAKIYAAQLFLKDYNGLKMTEKEIKDTLQNDYTIQMSPFAEIQKPLYFDGLTHILKNLLLIHEESSESKSQDQIENLLSQLINTYTTGKHDSGDTLPTLKSKTRGSTELDLYVVKTLILQELPKEALEYINAQSTKTNNMSANEDISLAAKTAAFSEVAYSLKK